MLRSHSEPQGAARAAAEFGPLLLVDTAGCDMEEVREEDGTSIANPGEAQVRLHLNVIHRPIHRSLMEHDCACSWQLGCVPALRCSQNHVAGRRHFCPGLCELVSAETACEHCE